MPPNGSSSSLVQNFPLGQLFDSPLHKKHTFLPKPIWLGGNLLPHFDASHPQFFCLTQSPHCHCHQQQTLMTFHLMVQTFSRIKYDPCGTEYSIFFFEKFDIIHHQNVAYCLCWSGLLACHQPPFYPISDLGKKQFTSDPHLATIIPAFQIVCQCIKLRYCCKRNIPVMPKGKK